LNEIQMKINLIYPGLMVDYLLPVTLC